MQPIRNFVLLAVGVSLLFSIPAYLFVAERPSPESEPVRVLMKYLKAVYARDYRQAYRLISAQERRLKKEDMNLRKRGAFTGFTLEVERKLSEFIQIRPVKTAFRADHGRNMLSL